ncbi:hypothetical protein GCM10020295_53210 [Streptomyces cinereospinus]
MSAAAGSITAMNAIFTTPRRPFDITALFPRLAPLARTATRLHPRPGSPTVHDSSVGGPLLWPADEPWPYCDGPHDSRAAPVVHSPDDVRLLRHDRAAAAERRRLDPEAPQWTPEERAAWERLANRLWFDGPIPLLPVAQLYAREIPFPRPPDADLLQVLWCPFDHEMAHPWTALFWRSSATVTDVLDAPPEPPIVQRDCYLPEPCLLSPEQVTEYPNPLDLDKELQNQLDDLSRWETIDPARYNTYADDPGELYLNNLSTAPRLEDRRLDPLEPHRPQAPPLPRVRHRAGPAPHHRLLGMGRRQRDLDRRGGTDEPVPASPGRPGRQLHPDRHRRRLQPPTPRLPGGPVAPPHRTDPVSP